MAITLHRRVDSSEQERLFYARERRKSIFDPTFKLFKTHDLGIDTALVATGSRFPVRTRPITFNVELRRGAGTPAGIVFELGDSTRGLVVWVDGSSVHAVAGDGSGPNTAMVTATDALQADGQKIRVTVPIIPGLGLLGMYVNSKLIAMARASSNMFPSWASNSDGAVGTFNGTVNAQVPGGSVAALSNANIIREVRSYQGQVPRQFLRSFLSGTFPLRPQGQGSFSESFSQSFSGGV